MTDNGLIVRESSHDPQETAERLVAAVTAKGMTVFARIDHAAGAAGVGMALRPTEVILFGAAKGGTPLMQLAQTVGIDLPLKALIWRDEAGTTWLGYNDPAWIARRHGVEDSAAHSVLQAMTAMLAAVSEAATAP